MINAEQSARAGPALPCARPAPACHARPAPGPAPAPTQPFAHAANGYRSSRTGCWSMTATVCTKTRPAPRVGPGSWVLGPGSWHAWRMIAQSRARTGQGQRAAGLPKEEEAAHRGRAKGHAVLAVAQQLGQELEHRRDDRRRRVQDLDGTQHQRSIGRKTAPREQERGRERASVRERREVSVRGCRSNGPSYSAQPDVQPI